jgi:hypothetical protein
MLAHTFRGSSWRSVLGLEDARVVFARYKAIRQAERQYVTPREGGGAETPPLPSAVSRAV